MVSPATAAIIRRELARGAKVVKQILQPRIVGDAQTPMTPEPLSSPVGYRSPWNKLFARSAVPLDKARASDFFAKIETGATGATGLPQPSPVPQPATPEDLQQFTGFMQSRLSLFSREVQASVALW